MSFLLSNEEKNVRGLSVLLVRIFSPVMCWFLQEECHDCSGEGDGNLYHIYKIAIQYVFMFY